VLWAYLVPLQLLLLLLLLAVQQQHHSSCCSVVLRSRSCMRLWAYQKRASSWLQATAAAVAQGLQVAARKHTTAGSWAQLAQQMIPSNLGMPAAAAAKAQGLRAQQQQQMQQAAWSSSSTRRGMLRF
jgi:TRAP-type uncharacterized transport system fused permease subunit